jgi:hypothetical protein
MLRMPSMLKLRHSHCHRASLWRWNLGTRSQGLCDYTHLPRLQQSYSIPLFLSPAMPTEEIPRRYLSAWTDTRVGLSSARGKPPSLSSVWGDFGMWQARSAVGARCTRFLDGLPPRQCSITRSGSFTSPFDISYHLLCCLSLLSALLFHSCQFCPPVASHSCNIKIYIFLRQIFIPAVM